MTRNELRLELLKLTYAHGRDPAEAVARARVCERYVVEESECDTSSEKPDAKKPKVLARKVVGNPESLA